MKAILAIVTGLFRVFTPRWFRTIFKMPWWAYGLLLAVWIPVTYNELNSRSAKLALYAEAEALPAPAAVTPPLADAAAKSNAVGEVHLDAFWRRDFGIIERKISSLRTSFAVIGNLADPGPLAVLVFPSTTAEEADALMMQNVRDDGTVSVHGLLVGDDDSPPLSASELAQFGLRGVEVLFIKQAQFSRDALYARVTNVESSNRYFFVGVALILAMATFTPLVLRYRRRERPAVL